MTDHFQVLLKIRSMYSKTLQFRFVLSLHINSTLCLGCTSQSRIIENGAIQFVQELKQALSPLAPNPHQPNHCSILVLHQGRFQGGAKVRVCVCFVQESVSPSPFQLGSGCCPLCPAHWVVAQIHLGPETPAGGVDGELAAGTGGTCCNFFFITASS